MLIRDYFYHDKSFESWEKAIIKLRKDGDCTKEQAREVWDFIRDELRDYDNYDLCIERFWSSKVIQEIAGSEWWSTFEFEKHYSPQALAFAHKLWPMFISVLKQEIKVMINDRYQD